MAGYTEGTGAAINLYRPVHRRVTGNTRSQNARTSILSQLPQAAFDKMEAYIRGDENTSVSDADTPARSGVRAAFTGQLTEHINSVTSEYATETQNVERANPGNEAAARRAMQPIVQRVGASLTRMRQQSLDLLN